jgi:adhesin transport system outer membrane protein
LPEQFELFFDRDSKEMTPDSRALIAVLAGCIRGPGSYVVLLPSPDGSVGKVVVQNLRGERVLIQAHTGVTLDGRGQMFDVGQEQLNRDFKAAIDARPPLPEQFTLFFETGAVELTAESKAMLPRIMERARARAAVDISVIGYTDTRGNADANEVLARKRAEVISKQLSQLDLQNLVVTAESFGERFLLVSTPDEVAEPRNRRVEITVR